MAKNDALAGVERKRSDNDELEILPLGTTLAELKGSGGSRKFVDAARYDTNSAKYHQVIHIQHPNAFTLRTMTVPDGTLAGRQVIVLEPIQSFRFLDLPTEIRAMVYDFLYSETKSVYRKASSGLSTRLRNRFPGLHAATVKLEGESTALHTLRIQRPIGINLLRVSKQVFHEVAPLVYAKHIFRVDFRHLSKFSAALGSMKKYLKHIHITGSLTSRNTLSNEEMARAKAGLQGLDSAVELRTLILDQGLFSVRGIMAAFDVPRAGTCSSNDLEALIYTMLPLLARIHAMGNSGSRWTVLDMVQIMAYHNGRCGKGGQPLASVVKECKHLCGVYRRINEAVQPKLRAWLAERLGIEETRGFRGGEMVAKSGASGI